MKFSLKSRVDKPVDIMKNLIFLASVIICMIGMTVAWFITAEDTGVDDVDFQAPAVDAVLVYNAAGGEWDFSTTIDGSKKKLTAICGNGKKFFAPTEFRAGDTPVYSDDDYELRGKTDEEMILSDVTTKVNANSGDYAFTYTERIRSSKQVELRLGDDCSVVSASDDGQGGVIGGALRVAIYEQKASSYQLRCIWFPNATYEYDYATGEVNLDGEIEESYTLIKDVNYHYEDYVEHIDTNDEGYALVNGVYYIWDATKSPALMTLQKGNVVSNIRIVIWIEGTDRECDNIFMGDALTVRLSLVVAE